MECSTFNGCAWDGPLYACDFVRRSVVVWQYLLYVSYRTETVCSDADDDSHRPGEQEHEGHTGPRPGADEPAEQGSQSATRHHGGAEDVVR